MSISSYPGLEGRKEGKEMPEELMPSCVNCQHARENCVIVKNLRDYKNHIQSVGLHCVDWEIEVNG